MTLPEVIAQLRDACRAAGSQSSWASAHGVSTAYVNDVLHGRKEPGPAILSELGLERVVSYRETH